MNHNAIKTYASMVSFTPQSLYSEEKHPLHPFHTEMDELPSRCKPNNTLPMPGIELGFLGRLARSPSLYQLSYSGSARINIKFILRVGVHGLICWLDLLHSVGGWLDPRTGLDEIRHLGSPARLL
jgi:hypothetical protein